MQDAITRRMRWGEGLAGDAKTKIPDPEKRNFLLILDQMLEKGNLSIHPGPLQQQSNLPFVVQLAKGQV